MDTTIFQPVVALVALTVGVWLLMYFRRLNEFKVKRIDPQTLATRDMASRRLEDVSAAENFSNLLETPVLFYVICLSLFVTEQVSDVQIMLAWIYVVLRLLHSVIHVTRNDVVFRIFAYASSTACLIAMWAIFAVSLLPRLRPL